MQLEEGSLRDNDLRVRGSHLTILCEVQLICALSAWEHFVPVAKGLLFVGQDRLNKKFGRLAERELKAGYLGLGTLDFRSRGLDIALVAIKERDRNPDRGEPLQPDSPSTGLVERLKILLEMKSPPGTSPGAVGR